MASTLVRWATTTFIAAIARHLRRDMELSRPRRAVVTIFLGSHDFEHRVVPSPLAVLETILRAVLRQLLEDLLPSLKELPRALEEKRCRSRSGSMTFEQLKTLIRAAAQCFDDIFLLIDDINEIPSLGEEQIAAQMRELGISFIMFVGVPLNRLNQGKDRICDACNEASELMAEAVAIVEIPLELPEGHMESFVEKGLSAVFPDDRIRKDAVDAVKAKSDNFLPLARLELDDLIENPTFEEIQIARDRLPLSTLRYFSFALQRVRSQTAKDDVNLGLTVLAIVSLAGNHFISYHALLGALACQSNPVRFGKPLNRTRISRVTQGWLKIDDPPWMGGDTKTSLFHLQAQIYLTEECAGFHDEILGEGCDLALICLNALTGPQLISDRFQGDAEMAVGKIPTGPFLEYALNNWGHHFRNRASGKTKDAAYEFFHLYQDEPRFKRIRLKTGVNSRRAVQDNMHLLAEFGLEELLDTFENDPTHLDVVDNITGRTPAMVACEAGHTEFVRKLIKHGADLTRLCRDGNMALHYAVQNAKVDVIRCILAEGNPSLVNAQDRQGQTALMLAVQLNADRFDRGAVDMRHSTQYAEILGLLLESKYLQLNLTNARGMTVLHVAAMRADELCLQLILERKDGKRIIDTLEHNKSKRTALMSLFSDRPFKDISKRLKAIGFLMQHGASTALQDARGWTVLHYAATSNDFAPILQRLLNTDVGVNTRNDRDYSTLDLASALRCKQPEKKPLGPKADLPPEVDSQVALMHIVQSSDARQTIERIVAAAACPQQERNEQIQPAGQNSPEAHGRLQTTYHEGLLGYKELHSAVCNASHEHVLALLSQATDVNATTAFGDTALHLAIQAFGGDTGMRDPGIFANIVLTLLDHPSIDLNIENNVHETAIDVAMQVLGHERAFTLEIMERVCQRGISFEFLRATDIDKLFRCALTRRHRPALIQTLLSAGANRFQFLDPKQPSKPEKVIAIEKRWDKVVVDILDRWEEKILELIR
ncbi:MAG: hypothetical protein M1822_005407 [Bathelium mastoideum]|nr:MAG: hypothetical protein M1822_005407 [Bathelium mastoideum]